MILRNGKFSGKIFRKIFWKMFRTGKCSMENFPPHITKFTYNQGRQYVCSARDGTINSTECIATQPERTVYYPEASAPSQTR
jgi:hypothetical protein